MKLKFKIMLFCLLLFSILITTLFFNKGSKETAGMWDMPMTDEVVSMLNHNLSRPFTTMDSEWIYFSEHKTGSSVNSPGNLYRMRHDGSEIEHILGSATSHMLIADGYLYYLDATNYSKLYTLFLDDYSSNLISDGLVHEFILVEEWIYFCEESPREYVSQMSKMKRDGSAYTVLIPDRHCQNLIHEDGYVYFASIDNYFTTYRMAVENGELELLSKNHEVPLAIYENTILSFNHKLGELQALQLDTGHSERLIKFDLKEESLKNFNFYKDASYAINGNRELIRLTQKGNKVIYNESPVEFFNIVGDWLFFSASNNPDNIHEESLYRMNLITGKIEDLQQIFKD